MLRKLILFLLLALAILIAAVEVASQAVPIVNATRYTLNKGVETSGYCESEKNL